MAFKMKAGNSPNKFLGALMGGVGNAVAGGMQRRAVRRGGSGARGARAGEAEAMAQKARAGSQGVAPGQRRRRPAGGLGQTLAGGGYQGFGVAPGQIMGQGRRKGGGMGMFGGG